MINYKMGVIETILYGVIFMSGPLVVGTLFSIYVLNFMLMTALCVAFGGAWGYNFSKMYMFVREGIIDKMIMKKLNEREAEWKMK